MTKPRFNLRAPEDVQAALDLLHNAARQPSRYNLTVAEWRTSAVIASALAWVLQSDGGPQMEKHLWRVTTAAKEPEQAGAA